MADFIPQSDDAINTWASNFKAKLAIHAPVLNIAAPDVLIYQNQCDSMIASIVDVNNTRQLLKNKVQTKDSLRSDTVSNLRTLANRIKTEPTYTDAIGNDLGIITTATVVDLSTAKPQLTLAVNGGQITVKFIRSKSNGVKIYSKRGSETAFTFLALDTHSPYYDVRPNLTDGVAETRQYYAFFIDIDDNQVGLQSDIVSVTI